MIEGGTTSLRRHEDREAVNTSSFACLLGSRRWYFHGTAESRWRELRQSFIGLSFEVTLVRCLSVGQPINPSKEDHTMVGKWESIRLLRFLGCDFQVRRPRSHLSATPFYAITHCGIK